MLAGGGKRKGSKADDKAGKSDSASTPVAGDKTVPPSGGFGFANEVNALLAMVKRKRLEKEAIQRKAIADAQDAAAKNSQQQQVLNAS